MMYGESALRVQATLGELKRKACEALGLQEADVQMWCATRHSPRANSVSVFQAECSGTVCCTQPQGTDCSAGTSAGSCAALSCANLSSCKLVQ